MIDIPKTALASTSNQFKELIKFFNNLEQELQYPNCEGYEDAKRILERAENQLKSKGVL